MGKLIIFIIGNTVGKFTFTQKFAQKTFWGGGLTGFTLIGGKNSGSPFNFYECYPTSLLPGSLQNFPASYLSLSGLLTSCFSKRSTQEHHIALLGLPPLPVLESSPSLPVENKEAIEGGMLALHVADPFSL